VDRSLLRRVHGFDKPAHQKTRRPAGMSRRRKKQLGFELLEDRRVMSAESPLASLSGAVNSAGWTSQSYSSATPEGQLQQLVNELYWQSLMSAGSTGTTMVPNAIPNDPLLNRQWHLINSGQNVGNLDWQPIYGVAGEDINVAPVWNMGLDGRGVRVAVIDSGVQLTHPDLEANIDKASASDVINTLNGNGNPTISLLDPGAAHGTSVAGLIAAVGNNNYGGAGVAYGATIVPIRAIVSAGQTPTTVYDALVNSIIADVDITNNSYGPGAPRFLSALTPQEVSILRDSVIFGRDGLGIIHVKSSGNGGGSTFNPDFSNLGDYDSSAYDGMASSRYVITVTGVDHDGFYNNVDGTVTSYPEAGSNVLVAAPTGSNGGLTIINDSGIGSGIWTADLIGAFGFNRGPNPVTGLETDDPFYPFDRDFYADTAYTSRFNGTSASAPIVSGVIALMLQANPNLSWRDVQEILVRSARQNAQFEIPQNGSGQTSQNTWIINQNPIFHDPDVFIPGVPISADLRTLAPTLDPNAGFILNGGGFNNIFTTDHHVAQPFKLTNGAGYTVSQGYGAYNEMIGYGHGVIDAEMAVKLAQQWSVKNQTLPSELTFTTFVNHTGTGTVLNIPAAERGSEDSGFQIVPGGLGGDGGFIALWNEYYVEEPDFTQEFPYRGDASMSFSVPASQSMSIETVEVRLSLSGSAAAAMDNLRILLVSPDGTYSELNHYWQDEYADPFTLQSNSPLPGQLPLTDAFNYLGSPGSLGAPDDTFVWSFTSNRSWGERCSDSVIFNPLTGEPIVDETGILNARGPNSTNQAGLAARQGWRVFIENWSDSDAFGLAGVEVAWHGSPIAAASQRVQGFVGVDDNRDDDFNYTRVNQVTSNVDNDPNTLRLGEIQNEIDLSQESFGANVTVTVRRTSDNALVDQFVTGADGNFYFDLVPDDYTITVEDPLGRTAKEDTTTGAQFLRHYKTEWQITTDWFKIWDHDAANAREVLIDPNNPVATPLGWVNDNGQTEAYGMRGINFLLDPGAAPAPEVKFEGFVYADTNGDGLFNQYDVAMPGVGVFGDVNRNGVRDAGEALVTTDATGKYTLTVPATQAGVITVGVLTPTGWTKSSPASGTQTFFVQPGNQLTGVDFRIVPPANNNVGGGGANQPGYLIGYVFNDSIGTGDGVQQASEKGFAGITVYIDANNSGTLDAGDTSTVTNQFGAFAFGNVSPGQKIIRTDVASPLARTAPGNNGARTYNLVGSATISNIVFGVRNTATLDFGDLPNQYHATLVNDTAVSSLGGARHAKSDYWLGERVDFELNGAPSANADGDDVIGIPDDEDGIEFITPLTPGTNATIKAIASRNGGYLQAWADWNNDGDFFDAGERIITNRLLYSDASQNFITFAVPAGASNQVYLRFRYGEFATAERAINTPFGPANSGEVEDYFRAIAAQPAVVVGIPGDFDQNGAVDGFDFLNWQRNMGRTTSASQANGNANGDSVVDGNDLAQWKQDFGKTSSAALVIQTGDFDGDEDVDGFDFLAMQRNFGMTTGAFVTQGDGNGDRKVDANDVALWTSAFGHVGLNTTAAASSAMTVASTGAGGYVNPSATVPSVDDQAPLDSQDDRRATSLPDAVVFRGEATRDRLAAVRRVTVSTLADAAWTTPAADYNFLRRDRAFDDLFGTRRRQGLRADLDFAADRGVADECDEAFAALADHFERPLG